MLTLLSCNPPNLPLALLMKAGMLLVAIYPTLSEVLGGALETGKILAIPTITQHLSTIGWGLTSSEPSMWPLRSPLVGVGANSATLPATG